MLQAALRAEREESSESAEPTADITPPSPVELHLLKLLLLHEELAATAALNLDANWIVHPHIRRIVELRLAVQQ